MKDSTDKATQVVELEDPHRGIDTPTRELFDAEAVEKLGLTPTVPRTLNKLIGLIGVNSSVVCPWPTFYFVAVLNLGNGGTAGLLVATIVSCIFMGPVYISLAEKIRKYPTAGGQYHWVAALAPPRIRHFLSFFCCCILTFTWLTYLMAATWQFGLDITAIVLIYTGKYDVAWTFASAIAMCAIACVVNLTWGKHMNIPETLVLVVHLVAFFLLVGLLAFANASGTLKPSFTFSTQTGWGNGVGTTLSIIYVVGVLSGFDCAAHIAEDTVDAAKRIPRSLLTSTTANKISCLVIAILICLTAGNVNDLFDGPLGSSGHPIGAIIQLTYNAARGNKSLACAPLGLIAIILAMCCINTMAAASRMVFSFIRDDNNPLFQKLFAMDLKRQSVPRLSICLVAIVPAMTLWINFVSSVGFQALGSQVTLTLATTYILAIGCSLYSRIYQPDLLGRKFTGIFHLGTFWGTVNDSIAIAFLVFAWVFSWFPFYANIIGKPEDINYAPIIIGGVAILGILYYVLYARKRYQNPAPEEIGNLES